VEISGQDYIDLRPRFLGIDQMFVTIRTIWGCPVSAGQRKLHCSSRVLDAWQMPKARKEFAIELQVSCRHPLMPGVDIFDSQNVCRAKTGIHMYDCG